MKHARLMILMMLFVSLTGISTSWAEGDKGSGKLSGWHSHYAKELNMTDEQIEQFKTMIKERNQAKEQWKSQNKDAYEQAKSAMDKARTSGDKDAYYKAKKEYYAAKKGMDEADKNYEKSFMALLTPEQKGLKNGLTLYNSAKWYTKKVDLTSEQNAQIKKMAKDEGASLTDASSKEIHKAKIAFKEKVISEVLTDEQRAALGSKGKSDKAKAHKKEKKEKTAKAKKEKKDK